jgi:deoxycytidine triphosphate deaminase
MAILSDKWIRRMAREGRMIEPFTDHQERDGVISYGLSSYGYDVRIADEFKIFTNINSTIVDPKHFDPRSPEASSTSASRATCWSCASVRAPTRAAASSST